MANRLHVAISPLTQRIYAGRVAKDGCTWLPGKQDVTSDVLEAVIRKVGAGNTVSVEINGEPAYEITIRDVRSVP